MSPKTVQNLLSKTFICMCELGNMEKFMDFPDLGTENTVHEELKA
jgi:hypothetical protein